jgi:hypothetical protein
MSFPHFASAFGLLNIARRPARLGRMAPFTSFSTSRRVESSTTSARSTLWSWAAAERALALSIQRSKFALAAAASNVSPSWNLTPFRSLKVMTLPPSANVQNSASWGMSFPSLSQPTRPSNITVWTIMDGTSLVLAGSSRAASDCVARTKPRDWPSASPALRATSRAIPPRSVTKTQNPVRSWLVMILSFYLDVLSRPMRQTKPRSTCAGMSCTKRMRSWTACATSLRSTVSLGE